MIKYKFILQALAISMMLLLATSMASAADPQLPSADKLAAIDTTKLKSYDPQLPRLGVSDKAPDWSLQPTKIMGKGVDLAAWRESTVIVTTEQGFGSGAIVISEGVVVTNYHVVASAVQQAALLGKTAKVEVITCSVKGKRVERSEKALSAVVLKVDPERDLAMLKIENEGAIKFRSFEIGEDPELGARCFSIGSQGGGLAWAIRSGNVSGVYDFPDDITETVIGVSSQETQLSRTKLSVIVTDCSISSGDSGGPLVDENGQLIGLTFATPTNLSKGSMGYHIAREHLIDFVKTVPGKPQSLPPDLWTAGFAGSDAVIPEPIDVDGDLKPDAIVCYVFRQGEEGIEMLGCVVYVADNDFGTDRLGADSEIKEIIPSKLWGRSNGTFSFDRFIVYRADGVMIWGFCDANGSPTEMWIRSSPEVTAECHWKYSRGSWESHSPVKDLKEPWEGLSPEGRSRLASIVKKALESGEDE